MHFNWPVRVRLVSFALIMAKRTFKINWIRQRIINQARFPDAKETFLLVAVYIQSLRDYAKYRDQLIKQSSLVDRRQKALNKLLAKAESYLDSNTRLTNKVAKDLLHLAKAVDKKQIELDLAINETLELKKENKELVDFVFDPQNKALCLIGVNPDWVMRLIKDRKIIDDIDDSVE